MDLTQFPIEEFLAGGDRNQQFQLEVAGGRT